METKQAFAQFIAQKRKEAGVTQEALAQALFVTHTTVSKWERGLSYPDIALVPEICRKLNISEHEFFTACEDLQARRDKKDARRWRGMLRAGQLFFLWSYGITLVVCFICDLAVFRRLDWFWIVFCSLALAFCFTNLPLLVQKERRLICSGAATGCLLLLLLSCFGYTRAAGLGFGIAVTAVCLALPWGLWAFARFVPLGRALPAAAAAVCTGWLFALLGVIALGGGFGGAWFAAAVRAALLPLPFAWGMLAVACYLPLGGWCKAACITALCAFLIPAMNIGLPAVGFVGGDGLSLGDYFNWARFSPIWVDLRAAGGDTNVYVFEWMLIAAAVLLAVGIWRAAVRRRG